MSTPKDTTTHKLADLQPAGIWVRFFALFYDTLIGLSVLFIGTAVMLPLTGGEAPERGTLIWALYNVYIISLLYAAFAWLWTHSGQTLGLKAWRSRLVSTRHEVVSPVTWGQSLIRFVAAIPGWAILGLGMAKLFAGDQLLLPHIPASAVIVVGLLWLLLDQRPDGIRDRLSDSRVVRLPRNWAG